MLYNNSDLDKKALKKKCMGTKADIAVSVQREINKFEPKYYPRGIANLSLEDYTQITNLSRKVRGRIAFSKGIDIGDVDKIDLHTLYSYMLRLLIPTNDEIFIGSGYINFNNDKEKALLNVLITDPDCKYLKLYQQLRNQDLSPIDIQKEFIKYYSFYSYRLLDLENQYVNLLENLEKIKGSSVR